MSQMYVDKSEIEEASWKMGERYWTAFAARRNWHSIVPRQKQIDDNSRIGAIVGPSRKRYGHFRAF